MSYEQAEESVPGARTVPMPETDPRNPGAPGMPGAYPGTLDPGQSQVGGAESHEKLRQSTLTRFEQTRSRSDEAAAQLRESIETLLGSSDLNERLYELQTVGMLQSLRAARDQALEEYRDAEGDLITELDSGLFPGEHRVG